jgi:hypothetical protein
MKLFWVTTDDHDEDWFVVASSPKKAERFFENYEGYGPGYADAEEILDIPDNTSPEEGWASNELLLELGAIFIMKGDTRVVEIGGRRFIEGMLEAIVNEVTDDLFEMLRNERPNKTKKSKPQ